VKKSGFVNMPKNMMVVKPFLLLGCLKADEVYHMKGDDGTARSAICFPVLKSAQFHSASIVIKSLSNK